MAKTIDVTLASIQNAGDLIVSPVGIIRAKTVSAVDDEQVFRVEALFQRERGQPMQPSGAWNIRPGHSLSFNLTKRLVLDSADQMLMIDYDLTDAAPRDPASPDDLDTYQGSDYRKVRYDDLTGFMTLSLDYLAHYPDKKILVHYTINLV